MSHDPTPPPLNMGARPFPADDLTCATLSALLWREGRARLAELGIGPEAFEDGEARMIATVLMTGRDFTPAELRVLWRDDGRTLPWGAAIDLHTQSPEWAVRYVDRFAAERARAWWPTWMEWVAEGMQSGQSLSWAVAELEALLGAARPLLGGRCA